MVRGEMLVGASWVMVIGTGALFGATCRVFASKCENVLVNGAGAVEGQPTGSWVGLIWQAAIGP